MATTGGLRTRWAAIGAAVAVSLGGGGIALVRATTSEGVRSVYVPITPCRLFDTRPSPYLVGARTTPLGAAEAVTFQVTGAVGLCTVPSDATGVAMNLTVVNPTQNGFVTVYPADAGRPGTASVNFLAGEVRQNSLQTKLSATGSIAIYNYAGATDVIADVTGYYVDHDHDDRYYTKAEVDGRTVTRTISVAAEGLNVDGNFNYITRSGNGTGLTWLNASATAATWTLARPADATGAGTITLTVWFSRLTGLAGNVSFNARPQDLNVGESVGSDATLAAGSVQTEAGGSTLRSVTITWPATGEAAPFWQIAVFRHSTVASAYPDSVNVRGLSLTYQATA